MLKIITSIDDYHSAIQQVNSSRTSKSFDATVVGDHNLIIVAKMEATYRILRIYWFV